METQQNQLEYDACLSSMVDEARSLMMPLEFANAEERVVTLAQYVDSDCHCVWYSSENSFCSSLDCSLLHFEFVFIVCSCQNKVA